MVSESEFYMWRTLFALAHVDDVIAKSESDFMNDVLENENLSDAQSEILKQDAAIPQDPIKLYEGISNGADQKRFFDLAYNLVMSDGDYHDKELDAITQLQEIYDRNQGHEDQSGDDIDFV